ncbi:MAG: hypothetical protein U9O18_05985 [Chloroflexota bacterium]|nr:hypothetical protein [Chloroflexota bacterium]
MSGAVMAQDEDDGYLATSVTGDYKYAEGQRFEADKTIVADGNLTLNRDLEQKRIYEWDDPRLPGTLELRYGWDEFRMPGTANTAYVEWGEATLSDDEGTWEGPFFGTRLPDASSYNLQFWLDGSGAYEGIYAVLTMDDARRGDQDIAGLIVEGELPPFVGAPAE